MATEEGQHARTWGVGDHTSFSLLSGDCNPLHMDPQWARCSLFGECIVHGMALALWALESSPAVHGACPARVSLHFDKAVRAGHVTETRCTPLTAGYRIEVLRGGEPVTRIEVSGETVPAHKSVALVPQDESYACRRLQPEEARNLEGEEPLWINRRAASKAWPGLVKGWGYDAVAALLCLSRIAGMRCPGALSLFLSATVAFGGATADKVSWRVRMIHRVTRRAEITLSGAVTGQLVALFRPEAVRQAAYASLASQMAPDLFATWRVIVVGGSRGLGEVAAKLCAAAGAAVTITSRRVLDADPVVQEIRAGGGNASALGLDVSDYELLPDLEGGHYTHLLYFATPPIVLDEPMDCNEEAFERYTAVYVEAFLRIFSRVADELRGVLYPSSVAVVEGMAGGLAYVAAKAAGELACEDLAKQHPDVGFCVPRLPRLPTDQSVSVLPREEADPVPVIREALLKLESIS
jgi:acyl dehydratase